MCSVDLDFEQSLFDLSLVLRELKKSPYYDVNRYLYSLNHQSSQLLYFYKNLCEDLGRLPSNTFYYLPKEIKEHTIVYVNLGRGFPKELMDGHWCYIHKIEGPKIFIIPTTSIKVDSGDCCDLEYDIPVLFGERRTYSRLNLSEMRWVDSQRVDFRKSVVKPLASRNEIKGLIHSVI